MTACGCEEVDAAVPRLRPRKPETHLEAQPPTPQGAGLQKYPPTDQMLEPNYPPRKPQGAGARRHLPTNPLPLAVVRRWMPQCPGSVHASPKPLSKPNHPSWRRPCKNGTLLAAPPTPAARSSHHSPGYTNPHCRRTSVSTDITSRLSVSCRTSSSGTGVSTPASRNDGGTPSPPPWRMSR